MFKIFKKLFEEPSTSLEGMVLQPLILDNTEPHDTLAKEMRRLLSSRGARFAEEADWDCEFDWEILGGSQLKVKTAVQIGPLLVRTDVREGFPEREVVDFDIERTVLMNDTKKTILFLKKAVEKMVEHIEIKFANYKASLDPR